MNVLYISHCDSDGHSANHVMQTATALRQYGVESAISFPRDPNSTASLPASEHRLLYHRDTLREEALFLNGRGPDLIHAWTPREHVRKLTEALAAKYSCRYLVHLEDNEDAITADRLGDFPIEEFSQLPFRLLDELVPPTQHHPRRSRDFLARSAGVTVLIDSLLEFKPSHVPGVAFWPGFDRAFLECQNPHAVRAKFGLSPAALLLVYNGNIHRSNRDEVTSLILAAGILHRRLGNIQLIKTGANHAGKEIVAAAKQGGYLVDLGFIPRADLPPLLSVSSVLIQPGRTSPFNDYRFPSKLPEFLAAGKPVLLPATNIGRELQDGVNCKHLQTGSAIEIADIVQELVAHPEEGKKIGQAGRLFATQNLDWLKNVEPVAGLYREILDSPSRIPDATLPSPEPLPVRLSISCPSTTSAEAMQAARNHGIHEFRFDRPLPRELHPENYLALALEQIGRKPTLEMEPRRVRSSGNPIYPLWLAAMVEQTMALRSTQYPVLYIDGWDGIADPQWLRNTRLGLARGIANYLRNSGLPVLDRNVERAINGERTEYV